VPQAQKRRPLTAWQRVILLAAMTTSPLAMFKGFLFDKKYYVGRGLPKSK